MRSLLGRDPKAIADRRAEFAVPLQAPLSARPEKRLPSFALSLVLHIGFVALLATVDVPRRPADLQITPRELLADERYRITLYTPKTDLPAVAPLNEADGRDGAERARQRFRQKIVADDPDPQSSRQKVVGLAPDIEIQQDIRSPNLLAWNAPKVNRPRFQMEQRRAEAPDREAVSAVTAPKIEAQRQAAPSLPAAAGPRLRFQQEKQSEPAPVREALAPRQAPELQTAVKKVDLAALSRQPRLRYWTQEAGPLTTPERQAIRVEAPPEIGASREALDLGEVVSSPRLRYWTSGNNPEAPGRKTIAADDAPLIEAEISGTPQVGSLLQQPRMRYQNWDDQPATPKRGALITGVAAPKMDRTEGLGGDGTGDVGAGLLAHNSLAEALKDQGFPAGSDAGGSRGLRASSNSGAGGPVVGPGNDGPAALVIGLDPDPDVAPSIPLGSRRGRFSAAPEGGPGGGDLVAGAGNGAFLRAPNLSVVGGSFSQPGPIVQRGRSGSFGHVKPSAWSSDNDAGALSMFQRKWNVRELGAPPVIDPEQVPVRSKRADVLFLDRQVFVLAINTPNVTSYSGSWVIRFAERTLNGKKRHDATRFGKENDEEPEDDSQGRLSAPEPRLKVDPKYIRAAADERVEGTVTLYAVIQRDGRVRDIEVVESLDDRLDDSATAALAQWEFHPATKLGVPVEVDVLIDIPFRLAPLEERFIRRF